MCYNLFFICHTVLLKTSGDWSSKSQQTFFYQSSYHSGESKSIWSRIGLCLSSLNFNLIHFTTDFKYLSRVKIFLLSGPLICILVWFQRFTCVSKLNSLAVVTLNLCSDLAACFLDSREITVALQSCSLFSEPFSPAVYLNLPRQQPYIPASFKCPSRVILRYPPIPQCWQLIVRVSPEVCLSSLVLLHPDLGW